MIPAAHHTCVAIVQIAVPSKHTACFRGDSALIVPYDESTFRLKDETLIAAWDDAVVPGEVELLPHTHYSPMYAWMYAYEKKLKRRIEKTLGRPLGQLERALFGQDGAVSEALSNAFLHGHRRDPARVIHVSTQVARPMLLVSVRDSGPGFDVPAALGAMEHGGTYFHMAGNGLRCLATSDRIQAAYTNGGRTIVLRVPLQ